MSRNPLARLSSAERFISLGLFLVVASVLGPLAVSTESHRRLRQTRQDLSRFIAVSEQFFVEYGYWPSPHMGTPGDMRYGRETGNDLVLNILRAVDGPGNEGHRLNPNRIVYLSPPNRRHGRSGVDVEGGWVDVWGSPYQIVFDTDMNQVSVIAHSIYPNQSDTGVIVWSYGPDRRPDTPRDILSWMMD
jgi:hypothetical protein